MSFRSFVKKYAPKKEHKYGASRTERAGYSFGSKLEAAVFDILKWREKAGEIANIKVQQRVYLLRDPDIYSIPDFSYEEVGSNAETVYVEAKGFATDVWKLKKKLWIHFGKGRLEIYGGNHTKPVLQEVIKSRAQGE